MKKIVSYLLFLAALYLSALGLLLTEQVPALMPFKIGLTCAVVGGLGGCLYCLRGVYLNACVRNQWDMKWQAWYFLRPIVSAGCGAVSYLFLQAGLLVLEAGTKPNSNDLGFYTLAFIAGLNVDKFMKKLEEVAESIWGIEQSRTSQTSDRQNGNG